VRESFGVAMALIHHDILSNPNLGACLMCRRVDCPKCGKPTFAGCGAHVEQVLGDVPTDKRCRCNEQASAGAAKPGAGDGSTQSRSWFSGLFSK